MFQLSALGLVSSPCRVADTEIDFEIEVDLMGAETVPYEKVEVHKNIKECHHK